MSDLPCRCARIDRVGGDVACHHTVRTYDGAITTRHPFENGASSPYPDIAPNVNRRSA